MTTPCAKCTKAVEVDGEIVEGSSRYCDVCLNLAYGDLPVIVTPDMRLGEGRPPVGWVLGRSNEDYHADKRAVSRSALVEVNRSPAHFLAAWHGPPREETPALRIGTHVHTATLEPERFAREVVARPDLGDGRTKEGKARRADFEASLPPGAQVVSADEYEVITSVAKSVRAHPLVASMFKRPHRIEQSGYWVDRETSVLCRMRPDMILDDGTIVDLKTTEDASQDAVGRSALKHGYHVQAAHYLDGVQTIDGKRGPWIFVFAEKKPPYAVAVYVADEAMLARGRAERALALNRLRRCIETNSWPAYGDEAKEISLPRWAFTEEDFAA